MRTYNRPVLLRRALLSVYGQSLSNWHLVVVNNGGNGTEVRNVVREMAEGDERLLVRTTVVDTGARLGMEAASNLGIRAVDSDYFVIHDDDDAWRPTFLERTVGMLQAHPECVAMLSGVTRVWERMRNGTVVEVRRHTFFLNDERLTYDYLVGSNSFPPICAVFRRSVLDTVGLFDESLPVLGDWDFNLRVLEHGRFARFDEELALYHTRTEDSDRGTGNSIIEGHTQHDEVREQLWRRWESVPALGHPGMSKGELSRATYLRHREIEAQRKKERQRRHEIESQKLSNRLRRIARLFVGRR